MVTDAVYWIWMQEALGIGSLKVDQVLEVLDSPKTLYDLDKQALRELRIFTDEEQARIRSTKLDKANRLLERAAHFHCQVVTPVHPDYPPYFTHIRCKPCVLYVLGTLSSPALSITIVGARKSTDEGRDAAFRLGRDLAAAGCQVVSGLAVGIDQAAHSGAVSVDGRTVGFLACGMNVDYPSESGPLKREILNKGGGLATEFPFDEEAKPWHFQVRNRLMAGISDGTVVVQAAQRSGALITADYALDQGREVFAVPGTVFNPAMVGCNRLIEEGARIVTSASSILRAFPRLGGEALERAEEAIRQAGGAGFAAGQQQEQRPSLGQHPPVPEKAAPKPPRQPLTAERLAELGVSAEAQRIYEALGDETLDCDTIATRSQLPVPSVVVALTELELMDLIVAEPGRRYRR